MWLDARFDSLVRTRRIVLYPQGYPGLDAGQSSCASLTHFCGGDLQRTFDLSRPTIQHTLKYALKIRAFRQVRPALFVLHRTEALDEAIEIRDLFDAHLPIADGAAWALYWDPSRDPSFPERARDRGELIGRFDTGAIWNHDSGVNFLVLSGAIEAIELLPVRVQQLHLRMRSRVHVSSPLGVDLSWTEQQAS